MRIHATINERPHPAMVPARRETGTDFHARTPQIRADGSPSGPMALRRASNATAAADTKPRSTPKLLLIHSPIARKRGFLADTNYPVSLHPSVGKAGQQN